MKRSNNAEKRPIRQKPVKNIELSEKNIKLRVILLIASIILALLAFGYGMWSCIGVESGWSVIEYSGSELNISNEFIFMYDLGKGDSSATAEYRELTSLYTEMTETAYKLFNGDETFADINSVAAVNSHINEAVKLDSALYSALEKFVGQGNRYIYISPVFDEYEGLFFGYNGSLENEKYDPYNNSEVATYYAKLAEYASAPEHVTLEFLEDSQVRLTVSEEYKKYAEANEITKFVDFMWLKNAFVIDYFADTLKAKGYTNGTLSSYDGFSRNLDARGEYVYDYNLFDLNGGTVFLGAKMKYSKPYAIVYLKDHMMDELDIWHYYVKADGSPVTPYIDMSDGLYRNSVGDMVSYATDSGCADVLLSVLPIYVSEELDTEGLNALADKGTYSVWCDDGVFKYNQKDANLTEIFDNGKTKYTAEYAGR